MKNTFKGFINYGVLSAEKRQVWTASAPHEHATVSEEVEITIPAGWELAKSTHEQPLIIAPWGTIYLPNEILGGNKNPHFTGYDESGNGFRIKLDWRMI